MLANTADGGYIITLPIITIFIIIIVAGEMQTALTTKRKEPINAL